MCFQEVVYFAQAKVILFIPHSLIKKSSLNIFDKLQIIKEDTNSMRFFARIRKCIT